MDKFDLFIIFQWIQTRALIPFPPSPFSPFSFLKKINFMQIKELHFLQENFSSSLRFYQLELDVLLQLENLIFLIFLERDLISLIGLYICLGVTVSPIMEKIVTYESVPRNWSWWLNWLLHELPESPRQYSPFSLPESRSSRLYCLYKHN